MNFEPTPSEMDFDPTFSNGTLDSVTTFVAESSIVRYIVLGSGGPDNHDTTDAGLRFVRHLLSTSRAMRFGFMPNFKNMDSIRELARDYIRRCGGSISALQSLHAVTALEN